MFLLSINFTASANTFKSSNFHHSFFTKSLLLLFSLSSSLVASLFFLTSVSMMEKVVYYLFLFPFVSKTLTRKTIHDLHSNFKLHPLDSFISVFVTRIPFFSSTLHLCFCSFTQSSLKNFQGFPSTWSILNNLLFEETLIRGKKREEREREGSYREEWENGQTNVKLLFRNNYSLFFNLFTFMPFPCIVLSTWMFSLFYTIQV